MSQSDTAQTVPLEGYLSPDRIEMLVVHCSDTPDDQPIGAKEIQEMHLGFGWDGIGYHQVIRRDGTREAEVHSLYFPCADRVIIGCVGTMHHQHLYAFRREVSLNGWCGCVV